jgi:hypothetical protein
VTTVAVSLPETTPPGVVVNAQRRAVETQSAHGGRRVHLLQRALPLLPRDGPARQAGRAVPMTPQAAGDDPSGSAEMPKRYTSRPASPRTRNRERVYNSARAFCATNRNPTDRPRRTVSAHRTRQAGRWEGNFQASHGVGRAIGWPPLADCAPRRIGVALAWKIPTRHCQRSWLEPSPRCASAAPFWWPGFGEFLPHSGLGTTPAPRGSAHGRDPAVRALPHDHCRNQSVILSRRLADSANGGRGFRSTPPGSTRTRTPFRPPASTFPGPTGRCPPG